MPHSSPILALVAALLLLLAVSFPATVLGKNMGCKLPQRTLQQRATRSLAETELANRRLQRFEAYGKKHPDATTTASSNNRQLFQDHVVGARGSLHTTVTQVS